MSDQQRTPEELKEALEFAREAAAVAMARGEMPEYLVRVAVMAVLEWALFQESPFGSLLDGLRKDRAAQKAKEAARSN